MRDRFPAPPASTLETAPTDPLVSEQTIAAALAACLQASKACASSVVNDQDRVYNSEEVLRLATAAESFARAAAHLDTVGC